MYTYSTWTRAIVLDRARPSTGKEGWDRPSYTWQFSGPSRMARSNVHAYINFFLVFQGRPAEYVCMKNFQPS